MFCARHCSCIFSPKGFEKSLSLRHFHVQTIHPLATPITTIHSQAPTLYSYFYSSSPSPPKGSQHLGILPLPFNTPTQFIYRYFFSLNYLLLLLTSIQLPPLPESQNTQPNKHPQPQIQRQCPTPYSHPAADATAARTSPQRSERRPPPRLPLRGYGFIRSSNRNPQQRPSNCVRWRCLHLQ